LLYRSILYILLLCYDAPRSLPPFPTRRSSDLDEHPMEEIDARQRIGDLAAFLVDVIGLARHIGVVADDRKRLHAFGNVGPRKLRSEEHTSELQSRENIVCRLLLEKKNNKNQKD